MSAPWPVTRLGAEDAGEVHRLQDAPGDEARVRADLSLGWVRGWIAREGERAAGFLVTWHVADELHVIDVVTRADLRRRGVGRALLRAALDYARGVGVRLVLLEVRRSNDPARSLYRSFEFEEAGVRERYYPDDEDAIEMRLALL